MCSGGWVEESKCRAVLGTAFAGGRGERGGRFAAGLRKRSGAECSAWIDRVGYRISFYAAVHFPLDIVKNSLILLVNSWPIGFESIEVSACCTSVANQRPLFFSEVTDSIKSSFFHIGALLIFQILRSA